MISPSEAKLIQKTVDILRMARKVIKKMHVENGDEGFQEEPSLSDLVLVAQIIGQTSTIDRLGEMGTPEQIPPGGAVLPDQGSVGPGKVVFPDLVVFWENGGWYVSAHPDFQQGSKHCQQPGELLAMLREMAVVCIQNRMETS